MLVKVETPFGAFVAKDKDLITEQIKKYGAHTRNELAMIKSLVSDDDIIFDVGAHIGTYSIPLAKTLSDKGKVYSFEPNPKSYYLLKHNVYLNELTGRIQCNNSALGSEVKVQSVSFKQFVGNSGSNYLYEDIYQGEDVNFDTIDAFVKRNYIDRVDWIKIDVEGRELDVLNGAKNTIFKFKPKVYLEICPSQLERFGDSPESVFCFFKDLDYKFFNNKFHRNSSNDFFEIESFEKSDAALYDVLAISEHSYQLVSG